VTSAASSRSSGAMSADRPPRERAPQPRPTSGEASTLARTPIRCPCRPEALDGVRSDGAGRRADRSRDAAPDYPLGHGEQVPRGTPHLGLLDAPASACLDVAGQRRGLAVGRRDLRVAS
jgi:hypothetical protein